MKNRLTTSILFLAFILMTACSTALDRATQAVNEGNYDQAIIEYDTALAEELSPEDKFAALSGRALVYNQQGKSAKALQDYGDALQVKTEDGAPAGDLEVIYRSRINIMTQDADWLQAAAELDNLISLDASNVELLIEKGQLLAKAEAWTEVVNVMDQAIGLSPTNADALTLRGTAHLKLTNYEKAIIDLKESLNTDVAQAKLDIDQRSNLAEAYFELGQLLYRLGEHQEAINNFTEALTYANDDNDRADILAERGFTYTEVDRYDEALIDINRAIELDPSLAIAYSYRSYIYAYQEKYNDAILDADKAIELGDDLPTSSRSAILHAKASALRNNGQFEEAIVAATESINLEPANSPETARTYNLRSQINYAAGHYADAVADSDQAIAVGAQDIAALPSFYHNRSRAHFQLDQIPEALKDQLAAVELGRESAADYEYLGDLYAFASELQNAISAYDSAIALAPDDPLLHYYQGEIYQDAGDSEAALANFQKAAELDETEATYFQSMANIYWSDGDYESAESSYKRAIAADPTNAWNYNNLGDIFYETERFSLAEAEYLNATNADESIALFPENLGLARRLQENYSGAVDAYSLALEIDSERAYSWYGRGYSYYLMDENQLAIADLQQAQTFELDQDFANFVDELLTELGQ